MSDFGFELVSTLVKLGIVVASLLGVFALMTWVERRVMGLIQFRWGPNRVGPLGLFQPIADGVKLLMKEDITPARAHRSVFTAAPAIAVITSLCGFAVVPFGPTIELLGRRVKLVVVDLDGGILWAFAATALSVYAIVMAGWSSRSKYSIMGGLRSSAQMVSYELAMGLSVMGVILVAGTLRPVEIVRQQAGWFWNWNAFLGAGQFLGFLVFVVAIFAETNRLPFDLPEAESELVAGYHTEYSSMKLAMFYMAEYIAMATSSAMAATLFLGGWQLGFPLPFTGWPLWILQMLAFAIKVGLFLFVYVWVRWTLPRFRYDQLMALGWKSLLVLALANLMVTSLLVVFDIM